MNDSIINRVKEAVNIVDIIGNFVSLKKKGVNYWGLCPFHADRNPSFCVNPAKQRYKCFVCGKGGDVFQFLEEHENMSFFEALKYCADKVHIEVEDTESTPEEREKRKHIESLRIITESATSFYQHQLGMAEAYLLGRGYKVDAPVLKLYRIGYASNGNTLLQTMKQRGYSETYLREANLTAPGKYGSDYDIFRERLIFPFLDNQGRPIGYTGRTIVAKEGVAKYSNTNDTPLFNKGSNLWGLYQARHSISQMQFAYLVEGQFDVISLAANGVGNAVASSGTALTEQQIKLLGRFANKVVLIYDGDAAGQKAAMKTSRLMLQAGMNVSAIRMPEGKDPDEMARIKKEDTDKFLSGRTKDIITYFFESYDIANLQDPGAKEEKLQQLFELIACASSETLVINYASRLSQLSSLPKDTILNSVKGYRSSNRSSKIEVQGYKPGVYGLEDLTDEMKEVSVHVTDDFKEFSEGVGDEAILYIQGKLSLQDVQAIRRTCTMLDVDFDRLKVRDDGTESTLMAAMAECYRNGITDISVFISGTDANESTPQEGESEDDYIEREYEDENWIFINAYIYQYHRFFISAKPTDVTPYILRCAELIACTEDSVRIVNFGKFTSWLDLKKVQLTEILKPYLAKRKSRMAINAQRDDDFDLDYDPDTLPDYVENDPKYNQMYKQCNFYPRLNAQGVPVCYIFKNGTQGHTMVGDFFMEPLLHIQSDNDEDNKRVVKINRRYYKQPIFMEAQSKAFLKKATIEERLIMLEAVNFTDGEEKHWTKIREWMSRNYVTCKEVKTYGNQQVDGTSRKEDNMFFAFSNGIYHQVDGEWRFEPVNELGVVTHNKKNYYLPAFSTIYAGSDNTDKYELISRLYYKDIPASQQCSFAKWADLMDRVYKMNDNGKWALLFAVMSAFRINIFSLCRIFTAPFFMGPMSSGKTQIAISIRSLFIAPNVPIFNLNFGTDAAMSTMMSTFRDVPVVLDEYNNKDISDVKFQALKDIVYDGAGKQKRKGTSSKEIENDKIYAPVIICGQETPQRDDNALMSRIIVCEVPKPAHQRTQEEVDLFTELKDIEEGGLSNVLAEILQLRPLMMEKFRPVNEECYKELKARMASTGEVDRLMKTASLFLATCKILEKYTHLQLPFTYAEFFEIAFKKINFQIELISKTDKLATFFKAMDVMIDTKAILEGRDFDIAEAGKVTVKLPGGERNEVSLEPGTRVLFLRLGAVFTQFARSSFDKEGSSQSTIEQNLRSNPAYIGLVNSRRFKWNVTVEVPRGNLEVDTSGLEVTTDNTMVRRIQTQTTSSSCIAMNYEIFRQIYDIDLQRSEICESPEAVAKEEDTDQQKLPF